jgi:DivIVA domain-containing protein
MPLTPADVHNVAFSKPPIGKRGYNEDEVDAFLDLVEAELARLVEENNDLRSQVNSLDRQLESVQSDLEEARNKTGLGLDQGRRLTPVPPVSAIEQTTPVPNSGPGLSGDHHVQAAKVLGLAQEMADRLTGEAKSESDNMLSEARTKSEQLMSEARAKSDTMVNEARGRAETMLNEARTRAETVERQAHDKATSLERDAERKHSEIIGKVTEQKNQLEKQVDQLRTFEREYRTRLKTMLESQLRDLEDRGPAAPNENTASRGYSFGTRAETA